MIEGYIKLDQDVIEFEQLRQNRISIDVDEINYTGKFKLFLSTVHERYSIVFDHVFSFRFCDEGDRLKTVCEIGLLTGIYNVQNSAYQNWLDAESYRQNDFLKHYSIITSNDIVDVLAFNAPKIERLVSMQ